MSRTWGQAGRSTTGPAPKIFRQSRSGAGLTVGAKRCQTSALPWASERTEVEPVPSPSPEPTWELEPELDKLQSYDPTEVTGERRMSAGMSFRNAAAQVQAVARMVDEISLDWDRLGPSKQNEVASQVRSFVSSVDGMLKMDSGRVDTTDETGQTWTPEEVRSQRDTYETEITNTYTWLLDTLQPLCVTAPARRAAQEVVREESASLSEEQVNELRQTFADLREQAREFERMRPVVEAQRELLGESGTTKLSADFEQEAEKHAQQWKKWFVALLIWVAVAGIGGVVFIYLTRPPDNATNAQIVSHIFLDLLVIGLALFVIRNFSLQFRAHRHMEVIARNKASALSTFNRIVAGQEPEIKAVVASALAQSVFNIDELVFGDSGAEHVTILERVMSPRDRQDEIVGRSAGCRFP